MGRGELIQEPKYRRGTAAQWVDAATNPNNPDYPAELMAREIGVETDTGRRKRGPEVGKANWMDLPYLVPKMFFGMGPPPADLGGWGDDYLDAESVILYGHKTPQQMWGPGIRLRSVTSAKAENLPAGQPATVTLDNVTGIMTFSIPIGARGEQGPAGPATLKPAVDPTPVAFPALLLAGTHTLTFNVPGATPAMAALVYPTDAALLTQIRLDPPVITADTVKVKATALIALSAGSRTFKVRVFP